MRDEVLWSKRESIERCIRRVREEYVGHEAEFATNHTRQDAIVLNLQRGCEASIDMANRMIKLRRLGYPKESKESFRILQRAGLICKATAEAMAAMVGSGTWPCMTTRIWIWKRYARSSSTGSTTCSPSARRCWPPIPQPEPG